MSKIDIHERFMTHIEVQDNGCWNWTSTKRNGYARFYDGRLVMAHNYIYTWLVGAIPNGLFLDHLCRNRGCVNPDHLEPVTARENTIRGISPIAVNAKKTYCHNGHELNHDNTFVTTQGWRRCRTCTRLRDKKYRALKSGQSGEE